MDVDSELRAFVESIRKSLPEESLRVDGILDENVHGLGFQWVETFADVTNADIRRRDEKKLGNQFEFFSKAYDRGSAIVKNCIDVSYVENLMWDLGPKDKKWAWPLIPSNLQALYIQMWGIPQFK